MVRRTVPLLVAGLALMTGCSSAPPPKPDAPVRQAVPDRKACQYDTDSACYTFTQLRAAYGIDRLGGVTGKGRTIAIVAPFGAPNLRADLETASAQLGLHKPNLKIVELRPAHGPAAVVDWADEELAGLAREAAMDVQAAHAFAPDANLVLYQVDLPQKSAETSFDDLLGGLKRAVGDGTADVVSLSFGFPEGGVHAKESAARYERAHRVLADAARKGITVVAAAGDDGIYDNLDAASAKKPVRTVDWPASDPLVTAVGGTRVALNDRGARIEPDIVWNDGGGASGGGLSAVFDRPAYQREGQRYGESGAGRAVPDVSLSASGDGSTMVYLTDNARGAWYPMYGTSLATPLFAGIVALAAQQAGKALGHLNPALYELAGKRAGIVDVTTGANGKHGHPAGPGYDLASGLGTVDAARLVPALARQLAKKA